MTVKITVGPPVLTINRNSTFMVTDYGGEIDPTAAEGVFADDTRFVSGYRLRLNGQPWQRVSAATVSYHSARIYLTNLPLHDFNDGSTIEPNSIALRLLRAVDEGLHELFEITNYNPRPVKLVLELELRSDFADLFEVKTPPIRERENLVTRWDGKACRLVTTYRNEDYLRRFIYQVARAEPPVSFANGQLRFPIHLGPEATWRAEGLMLLQHGGQIRKPRPGQTVPGTAEGRAGRLHQRWLHACTRLETPNDDLRHTYRESVDDMSALRLFEQDLGPDVWIPAAGVPWFVTIFGRDSLIASLQNLMVHARFAEGTLRTLATYQAKERDDWRDAQPGKIVHELRHGELAHFNLVPHTRYYGTWDATPLFLIVLREAWRWLGDRQLVADMLAAAERCLGWIDTCGDLDGDGFQEYKTYSKQGYENMGWKDAHDAVVYPDGSQVAQPKALCELQGYVYQAKLGLAEVYAAFGKANEADALRHQAADLKRRFNEAFWMEDEGTYAFGLDRDKRQIKTVASNAGHCLWSGIADSDKAARVAERLLRPDMWSGWGIRTLSARHPAYNPFSYQRGSVWPHDNAIAAAGFARYGLYEPAQRVARGLLDAAARFDGYRLPEVFAGLRREPARSPSSIRAPISPRPGPPVASFRSSRRCLGCGPTSRMAACWWIRTCRAGFRPWSSMDCRPVGASSTFASGVTARPLTSQWIASAVVASRWCSESWREAAKHSPENGAPTIPEDPDPMRNLMPTASTPEVVVVTGAGAGLGRAIVQAFAKRGAYLGLIARGSERLEDAKSEVESLGGRALVLPADVADAAAVDAAAAEVEASLGPIDVWVNDAMTTVFAPVSETTPADYQRVTEVTYLGFVYGTLAALKRMRPRNRGTIVQVGSALAYRSIPLQSAYCGAKHAMVGFTDSLRSELIHDGSQVRVTVVHMPALNTPQFRWCKSRMPRQAQPVPPIFQPEVGAEAVYWAAHHDRRELLVGWPTIQAVWGQKLIPGLLDRYLATMAWNGQMTNEAQDQNRPDDLFEPVPGHFGAHGSFDDRAAGRSYALWANTHRSWLAAAGAGLAAAAVGLARSK